MTQSVAILRYLGRKHDLTGVTDTQIARVDLLSDVLTDYMNNLVDLCYMPNFDTSMITSWKDSTFLSQRLRNLENFLVSGDGPWWSGHKLTWVDFQAWEHLDWHRRLIPDCLDGLDN